MCLKLFPQRFGGSLGLVGFYRYSNWVQVSMDFFKIFQPWAVDWEYHYPEL